MTLTGKQKIGIGVGLGAAAALGIALAARAAPPVVVCEPGVEKCIGRDWCRCKYDGTGWVVVTPNATECAAPTGIAILYGTVKDAQTGTPIGGISVACNGYSDTTGTDGTYRIENILPGEYSVQFEDSLGRYETKVI